MSEDSPFQIKLHLARIFAEIATDYGLKADALKALTEVLDRYGVTGLRPAEEGVFVLLKKDGSDLFTDTDETKKMLKDLAWVRKSDAALKDVQIAPFDPHKPSQG